MQPPPCLSNRDCQTYHPFNIPPPYIRGEILVVGNFVQACRGWNIFHVFRARTWPCFDKIPRVTVFLRNIRDCLLPPAPTLIPNRQLFPPSAADSATVQQIVNSRILEAFINSEYLIISRPRNNATLGAMLTGMGLLR